MKFVIALCCALVAGVSLKAMATAAIWTVEITYRDRSDEARTAMENALAPYASKHLNLQRGNAFPLHFTVIPLKVRCPQCNAPEGQVCTHIYNGEPAWEMDNPAEIHAARIDAAIEKDWSVPPGYDPSKPYYGEPTDGTNFVEQIVVDG